MPRFQRDFVLFLAVQLAVAASVLWLWPARGTLYLAAFVDKHAWSDAAPGPRILFAGGSSLAFGLNSYRIREAFGREPVNLALQGYLGHEFTLAEATNEARPGDTVVFAIESMLFQPAPPANLSQLLMMEAPSAFWAIPGWTGWRSVLDEGLLPFRLVFVSTWQHLKSEQSPSEIIDNDRSLSPHYLARHKLCERCTVGPAYRRWSFNGFGDHVAHWGQPAMTEFAYSPPPPVDPRFAAEIQGRVVEDLNRVFLDMKEKGVHVVYTYPPVEAALFSDREQYFRNGNAELLRSALFPVLGALDDVVYPRELFYDSPFHLTSEGSARYTSHLVEQLTPILQSDGERGHTDAGSECAKHPVRVVSGHGDEWIGRSATVCIQAACVSGPVALEVHCTMPEESRPVEIGLWSGAQRIGHVSCAEGTQAGELQFEVEPAGRDFVHLDLKVSRTFIPSEADPGNPDNRTLGALVRVSQE